jgi:hypothetical protein
VATARTFPEWSAIVASAGREKPTSNIERRRNTVKLASEALTLADFSVPIPVHCFHCEKRLPKSSPVELQEPYVLVSCPKCGCITTGKVEAA